jgi:hypothetical protein
MAPASAIDSITASVVQGALENIAVEMGYKLMRMSYSSIIAPRCAQRLPACATNPPEPRFPEPGRMAACFAVPAPPVSRDHTQPKAVRQT